MASRDSFLSTAYTAARLAGLPDTQARLAASQAALESGFGRRAPGNNFFGIKAGKNWTGKRQNLKTWESVDGRRVNITAAFRAYDTPQESFQDWARTVGRRWPGALTAETFPQATSALRPGQTGGYATDPAYASKLNRINGFMTNMGLGQDFNVPRPTPRADALATAPMRPDNVAYAGPQGNFSVNTFGPVGAVQRGPLGPASPRTFDPVTAPSIRDSGAYTSMAWGGTPPSAPPAGSSRSTPGQALAYGQLGGTMAMAGVRNLDGTMARETTYQSPALSPVAPPSAPKTVSPSALANAYSQYGSSLASQAVRLDGTPTAYAPDVISVINPNQVTLPSAPIAPPTAPVRPAAPVTPPTSVMTPPTSVVAPVAPPTATVAPTYTPPATVAPMTQGDFPARPAAPPQMSVSDVYGGMQGTALSNAGIEVSRDPAGFVSRYNPETDITSTETPQGYTSATRGRVNRTTEAKMSQKTKQGLQKALGGLAGSLAGGALLGPVGGMLGGFLGNQMLGGNFFGGGVLSGGMFGGLVGGTRVPGSNRSYEGMRDISPRAADAISKGSVGLY